MLYFIFKDEVLPLKMLTLITLALIHEQGRLVLFKEFLFRNQQQHSKLHISVHVLKTAPRHYLTKPTPPKDFDKGKSGVPTNPPSPALSV